MPRQRGRYQGIGRRFTQINADQIHSSDLR